MKLFFGTKEVLPNEQVHSSVLNAKPVVEFKQEDGERPSILLYNTKTRNIQWFNYDGKDIIPYTRPYNNDIYSIMVIHGDTHPPLTSNNLKDYKPRDFFSSSISNDRIEKYSFSVTGIVALPANIQRMILDSSNLDIKGALSFCEVNPQNCTLDFWKEMARKWLTVDQKILDKLTNEEIKFDLNALSSFLEQKSIDLILNELLLSALAKKGYEKVLKYWPSFGENIGLFTAVLHSAAKNDYVEVVNEVAINRVSVPQFLDTAVLSDSIRVTRYLLPEVYRDYKERGGDDEDFIDAYLIQRLNSEKPISNILTSFLELNLDLPALERILLYSSYLPENNITIIKQLLEFKPVLIEYIPEKYRATDSAEVIEYLNKYPIPQDIIDEKLYDDHASVPMVTAVLKKNPSQQAKNNALTLAIEDAENDIAILLKKNGAI